MYKITGNLANLFTKRDLNKFGDFQNYGEALPNFSQKGISNFQPGRPMIIVY